MSRNDLRQLAQRRVDSARRSQLAVNQRLQPGNVGRKRFAHRVTICENVIVKVRRTETCLTTNQIA